MHEIDPALRNTIIVGRAEEELARLPAGSIPLFLFSPPYNLQQRSLRSGTNVGVTRGERLRRFAHSRTDAAYDQRGGNGKWQRGVAYDGYADRMPWPAYIAWQQDILRRCWNLLTEDGAICYVHKPRLQDGLCTTPLEYNPGLPLRQVVIWKRAGGVNCAPTHFMPTHEWVCIFAKPAFRLRDRAASAVGDVWSIAQEMRTWHRHRSPGRSSHESSRPSGRSALASSATPSWVRGRRPRSPAASASTTWGLSKARAMQSERGGKLLPSRQESTAGHAPSLSSRYRKKEQRQ